MTAKLFCKFGDRKGDSFVFENEAGIGRGHDAEIRIPHPVISGLHARITRDKKSGNYILEDLGSSNGTWLDGSRVTGKEKLGKLNIIRFAGQLTYFFQDLDAFGLNPGTVDVEITPTRPDPDMKEGKLADKPEAKETGYRFILAVTSLERRLEIPLKEGTNLVGRSIDAELHIDNEQISRRHAELTLENGAVTVKDLGSTNHTYVNGEEVTEVTSVAPNATIKFGKVECRLLRTRKK